MKTDALTPKETERIRMLLSKLPISYLFDFSVSTDYGFLNSPLLRGENGLLRVASEITILEDLNRRTRDLIEVMGKIRNDRELTGFETAVAASWMTVVAPEVFMPTNNRTVGKIQEVLKITRFWGGNWENKLGDFVQFLRNANLVKNQLGIESMVELAFYISKYESQGVPKYWIEVGNPPTIEYIGRFLWAPYSSRWSQLEKIRPGDIVYHYITSRGPSRYRGSFVGKSRVKHPIRMVSREELRRLIQNATSSKWTETYAEFTNRWFSQYESFYLVELEAFAPFNPPILKEEVGFNPPQSYFTEAPEEVVRKLEGHPEEELLIFQKLATLLKVNLHSPKPGCATLQFITGNFVKIVNSSTQYLFGQSKASIISLSSKAEFLKTNLIISNYSFKPIF